LNSSYVLTCCSPKSTKSREFIVNSCIREGVIVMLHTVLWGIVIVVLILWLLGLFFRIAGGIIRILLAVAAVIIVVNIITYILRF